MKPVIAIIGAGGHAKRLAQAVHLADASVSAFYVPHRRPRHQQGTTSWSDVMRADAVMIASPDDSHVPYVQRLCDSGFAGYVFLEKVFAVSIDELAQLRSLVHPRMFFHRPLRFSRSVASIKQWISAPAFGDLVAGCIAHGYGIGYEEWFRSNWRSDRAVTPGGVLQVLGIHFIDLVDHLVGETELLSAHARCLAQRPAHAGAELRWAPDTCDFELRTAQGGYVKVVVSYCTPMVDDLVIIGTNRIVRGGADGFRLYGPRAVRSASGAFVAPPVLAEVSKDDDFEDGTIRAVAHFVRTVRQGCTCDRDEQAAALRVTAQYLAALVQPRA